MSKKKTEIYQTFLASLKGGPQCSRFFKRTCVDKNTDLIRTHFFFKYRPNTDPILAHLKKIQTSQ